MFSFSGIYITWIEVLSVLFHNFYTSTNTLHLLCAEHCTVNWTHDVDIPFLLPDTFSGTPIFSHKLFNLPLHVHLSPFLLDKSCHSSNFIPGLLSLYTQIFPVRFLIAASPPPGGDSHIWISKPELLPRVPSFPSACSSTPLNVSHYLSILTSLFFNRRTLIRLRGFSMLHLLLYFKNFQGSSSSILSRAPHHLQFRAGSS